MSSAGKLNIKRKSELSGYNSDQPKIRLKKNLRNTKNKAPLVPFSKQTSIKNKRTLVPSKRVSKQRAGSIAMANSMQNFYQSPLKGFMIH